MTTCPFCGAAAASGQEYCLDCGIRLQTARRAPHTRSAWVPRAALATVVALAGAAVAVAAEGGSTSSPEVITATGGFATVPTSSTDVPTGNGKGVGVVDWPVGEDGWTVVLASLPQTAGRRAADERARKARAAGLEQVGVLDSSRYASLHPGYWVVFTGIYSSEAEATSALEAARGVMRTATVRRVVS
jgi:hypothetical protein